MALKIRIADSSLNTQSITLGSNVYNLRMMYNTSDKSWYFNISSPDGEVLARNIKVMPNQNLTGRFAYRKPLPSGDIWCFRVKNDFTPIGRNNFGVGKTYELWWLSNSEMEEQGLDDTVQL